jgi:hypothetical protein
LKDTFSGVTISNANSSAIAILSGYSASFFANFSLI